MARRVDPHTFMVDRLRHRLGRARCGARAARAGRRTRQRARACRARACCSCAGSSIPRSATRARRSRCGRVSAKAAEVGPAEITAAEFGFGSAPALLLDGDVPGGVRRGRAMARAGSRTRSAACRRRRRSSTSSRSAPAPRSCASAHRRSRVVVLPAGTTVNGVRALANSVADDKGWTEIEIVGLPGDGTPAAGTDLLAPQGLVNALTDPVSAALDRFRRGAPLYGWDTRTRGRRRRTGVVARRPGGHHQALPRRDARRLRRHGRQRASRPTSSCADYFAHPRHADGPDGTDAVQPVARARHRRHHRSAQLARSPASARPTTPQCSAASATSAPRRTLQQRQRADRLHGDRHVRRRPSATSVEWAALLLGGVSTSLPPATPAAVTAVSQGLQSPATLDGPFQPVVTVSWDATPTTLPFHLGSQALARRGLTPGSGAVALMDKRPNDVALQPIGASVNATNPARRAVSDSSYEIDGAFATNALRYSVATQDIFGRWSKWGSASCDVERAAAGQGDAARPTARHRPSPPARARRRSPST